MRYRKIIWGLSVLLVVIIAFYGLDLYQSLNFKKYVLGTIGNGENSGGHHDPYSGVFFILFIIIFTAVMGRFIARKAGQSPVLGELTAGIIAGAILYSIGTPAVVLVRHHSEVSEFSREMIVQNKNLEDQLNHFDLDDKMGKKDAEKVREVLLNPSFPQSLALANHILLLSSLGVILLLFMVGLESSYEDFVKTGFAPFGVAILGVLLPFVFGYFSIRFLFPDESLNVPIFVGATLAATSIGITARVFKDMKKLAIMEAKIVLGAAVIDDILGLILLAVVAGLVTSGEVDPLNIGIIVFKAFVFLVLIVWFGKKVLRKNIWVFSKFETSYVHLLFPFALLMILAFLADLIGLASIVGAFAAGLILKEEYFEGITSKRHETVESLIAPIEGIFAPVFFVIMGLQVDITTFLNPEVLGLGLILTVVAIVGKLGATIFLKKSDRLTVGIGLIPRGEVGLIFASIGKSLGVLDSNLFSAVIIVVILTTLITPPGLKWAIARLEKRQKTIH